jgi:hypothetical protein
MCFQSAHLQPLTLQEAIMAGAEGLRPATGARSRIRSSVSLRSPGQLTDWHGVCIQLSVHECSTSQICMSNRSPSGPHVKVCHTAMLLLLLRVLLLRLLLLRLLLTSWLTRSCRPALHFRSQTSCSTPAHSTHTQPERCGVAALYQYTSTLWMSSST